MRMVHVIPAVLLLGLGLLASCSSGPNVLPPIDPDQGKTPKTAPPPQKTRQVILDSRGAVFHRVGCPRIAEVPAESRVALPDPWEALNRGGSPCGHCEPLRGWK